MTTQQQQTQQHTQSQAEHALQQHAAAHGLPNINWGALLPILIQLVQALSQGGGAQPQAQAQAPQQQASQPKTP